jgi:type II secretory pathway pseudopilin PulG
MKKQSNPAKKEFNFKRKSLPGFTLMEIVVSLIILAAVFGGITATFIGVKRYVSRASRRLTAVNLGRQVLNSLYTRVRADTWNTGLLSVNVSPKNCSVADVQVPNTTAAMDGFAYGPNTYTVSQIAGREYREVTVTITYPTN